MNKGNKVDQYLELAWREFEQRGEILNNAEKVLTAAVVYKRELDRLAEEKKRLRETLEAASNSITRLLNTCERDGDTKGFINASNQAFCSVMVINELLSDLDRQPQVISAKQEFKPLDFVEIGRLEK